MNEEQYGEKTAWHDAFTRESCRLVPLSLAVLMLPPPDDYHLSRKSLNGSHIYICINTFFIQCVQVYWYF